MTAGGWIAEVCYNSTGRRVILLVGSKASSHYTLLQGIAGSIHVIGRHLQVFASHATTRIRKLNPDGVVAWAASYTPTS
jgi:hypothetical protein